MSRNKEKKRKLSLLKIHLIAGKMAHTLILQARLICFSKPLRDLFDQKHSTWSFFWYILLQNCPFYEKNIEKFTNEIYNFQNDMESSNFPISQTDSMACGKQTVSDGIVIF